MPAGLHDHERSAEFYNSRYSGHYMEEWPAQAKARVSETLLALNLPSHGEALDFGSGNGIMTDVISRTLGPGWRVTGCDFSAVAVENSRRLYPQCEFQVSAELQARPRRFDLVFTHHVLEHVSDLPQAVAEIAALAKDSAAMVHILPCGNSGSLEHRIASLREHGMDPNLGNRFFFEDEGHLRRLTSTELTALFAPYGFRLEQASFRNQDRGAVEWISRTGPGLIRSLTSISKARNPQARRELAKIRRRLVGWWLVRYPSAFTETRWRRRHKSVADVVLMTVGAFLYPVSKLFDIYLRRRAEKEWLERKSDPAGSEMFLSFRR